MIAAIAAARMAVEQEDAAALDAAAEAARGAMNRIFALAVKKYAAKAGEGARSAPRGSRSPGGSKASSPPAT